MSGKTEDSISAAFEKLQRELSREERRVRLTQRIISDPALLIHATPEAKGAVLYQLTRHDWRFDGLDGRNHRGGYYAEGSVLISVQKPGAACREGWSW